MTETKSLVLPVFNDREFTELTHKQAIELANRLTPVIDEWIASFANVDDDKKLAASSIGMGVYAALWNAANQASDEFASKILAGCATTLLKNDTKFQLMIADLPSLPN